MAIATKSKNGTAPQEALAAPVKLIQLRRLSQAEVSIAIEGVTPVIPHRWSEKSLRLMRDKQFSVAGGARQRKEPKNPEEEAEQSCYWLDARHTKPGMPAVAFKAAMVGACRFFEEPSMTLAKLLFYVVGEGPDQLIPIEGDMTMREDTPRNSGGTVDLRYRYQIWPWSASLTVRYLANQIDAASVANLVDAAGKLGVGDWRPSAPKSSTGTYGQWRVVETR
jgi:hypothetical protein